MKYKDNNFSKFQDRQRDGLESPFTSKSDRQIRREREHRLSLFYSKRLAPKVEKAWWSNLKEGDREKIETSYYNQARMLEEEDLMNMWSNFEFFDSWEEWFEYINGAFKPNMSGYREAKLKKLGI